jgi:2',3'-cyclic-nucleotide 2'-phosphodiesterase/3'-nucleotidase
LAVVKITGAQARQMFAKNFESKGGILSLAGGVVEGKCLEGKLSIELRRANGKPVRDDDTLTIATNDFLATGGDSMLPNGTLESTDETSNIRDMIADSLRQHPEALGKQTWFSETDLRIRLPSKRPVHCSK